MARLNGNYEERPQKIASQDDLKAGMIVARVDKNQKNIIKLESGPHVDARGTYFRTTYLMANGELRNKRSLDLYLQFVGLDPFVDKAVNSWLQWPTKEDLKVANQVF